MTTNEHKVVACVDLSPYADHVVDYAAWAATRMSAPLELLHVIDRHPELRGAKDRSGAIGTNAQEKLLQQLTNEAAERSRAEREAARVFLQSLRERAVARGAMAVDTRQRHGELEETLSEQQHDVRLYVVGRRGVSAGTNQRELGRHVEWIVRSLKCPILTVTDGFKAPESVLIAFDGSAITRQGVEMVASSPLFKGLPVHLLMSGRPSDDGLRQMEWARQTLAQADFDVRTQIEPGDPETVIGEAIQCIGIDLLIMGAYTHSPLRQLLTGSKTTELLRSARVPTLLLR